MKTSFYLKGSAIICTVTYNYNRLRLGTGITVNPTNFDKDKQSVKKSEPTHPELNQRLSNIKTFLQDVYRRFVNDNGKEPAPDFLKNEIARYLNKPTATNSNPDTFTFFQFAEYYIKQKNAKPARLKLLTYSLSLLKSFATKRLKKLDFNTITLDVCLQYEKFLSIDKGFNPNTTGKHIKLFKHFLNEATERGYNTNLSYKSRKFVAPKNESEQIYLTEPELQTLYTLDLTQNIRLQKVRDLFLIGCYTGLRFSDFTLLQPENISGDFIKITTQKTGKKVEIPLHPIVKTIFEKYGNAIPKPISNQKMNVFLKELAILAGIDTPTQTVIHRGKMRTTTTSPKFDLVCTHTARRSFATNAYLAGLGIDFISTILGHTTITQTQTYLKLDAKQKAIEAAKHAFFKPKLQIAK